MSRSWIYSLIQLRRSTGNIAPRPHRRRRKQKLVPYEQEVRQLVADHPDATLAEFCEMLSEPISVSTTALCDFFRHLTITRKKTLIAAKRHHPDVVQERKEWKKLQEVIDTKRFVFIDETWENMNRTPTIPD